MCNGSRERLCWCSVAFSSQFAVRAIRDFLERELFGLTAFEDQYRELVRQASSNVESSDAAAARQIEAEEKVVAREKSNIMATIRETGPYPLLKDQLDTISRRESELKKERDKLERLRKIVPMVPQSTDELRAVFRRTFESLTADSYEFADAFRKLFDGFWVYLVRLCDGGNLLPRAKIVLTLDRLVPDMARVPGMAELLRREVTIDLFEPPQRERIRKQVVEYRDKAFTEKEIVHLIEENPTVTAIQESMALHRKMTAMGLSSPYILAEEPPVDYTKLRRHKHESYRFQPLEGYVRPPLE